ncbi:MAG: hypothetical protein ACK4OK_08835, partial [Thermoflexus sp.]
NPSYDYATTLMRIALLRTTAVVIPTRSDKLLFRGSAVGGPLTRLSLQEKAYDETPHRIALHENG